ncbi:ABC transporter permease [Haladaptatus salinisoli]|uniref:ABC transporter permease n=1 Tax=Haladaptatus salinisoli TaxID=2884876 RepID=UPI001D0AE19F|nr:ABC transporter permease [Haladaptatus salinisoli]
MSDASIEAEDIPLEVVSDVEQTWQGTASDLLNAYVVVPGKILLDDKRAILGFGIVLTYVLIGTVGVWLLEPTQMWAGDRLEQPFQSMEHPLGTDTQGRDLMKLLVFGTPPMLLLMLSGGLFVVTVGTLVGTVAGFSGGRLDEALSTMTDVALTIPGLPLIIVLTVTLKPENPVLIGVLLGINGWGGLARNLRSQVLGIREEDYVEASTAMGVSTGEILLKDVLPNVMPYVLYNFMSSMRGVLFTYVGLSYLSVLPWSVENWGIMMDMAYSNGALTSAAMVHWIIWPIVMVAVLSLGLILLSQSTDKLFNPRVRARHQD